MSQPFTAAEFICKDDEPQWHDERDQLITASVAPCILGVHRYGSLLQAWTRLRGDEILREPDDNLQRTWLWGHALERAMVHDMHRSLGHQATMDYAGLYRSTSLPFLGATVDATVTLDGETIPLEFKSSRSSLARDDWEDGAPPHVVAQMQHQMLVTGARKCMAAVTIMGHPPIYTIADRDPIMIEALIKGSEELMRRVRDNDPPPPDGSDGDAFILAQQEIESGKAVMLGPEDAEMAHELDEVNDRIRDLDKRRSKLRQQIRARMGSAEIAHLPGDSGGFRVVYTSRPGYVRIDNAGLMAVERALRESGITDARISMIDDRTDSYIRRQKAKKGIV